jgi:hypothetical protein
MLSSADTGTAPTTARVVMPPSEPRPSRTTLDALDANADRPARLQLVVALILGLVLVAIPLYLWRRPRAQPISVSAGGGDGGGVALPAVTAAAAPRPEEKLVLGEPTILSCHDPGPKKTAPEQCDHVPEFEKAFAKAIEDQSSCVPKDVGGGTIIYVADIGFKKKSLLLTTPKEGRTIKNAKVAGACERAVKNGLAGLPFEAMKHEHARYRISITASYPGAGRP